MIFGNDLHWVDDDDRHYSVVISLNYITRRWDAMVRHMKPFGPSLRCEVESGASPEEAVCKLILRLAKKGWDADGKEEARQAQAPPQLPATTRA